jgi:protein AroM
MASMIGESVELLEAGALDNMTSAELAAMAPVGDEVRLATRLADGSQIVISHEKTVPLVQERITELNQDGVDLILIMCTGHFPVFESRVLVLEAQKIVDHALEAVMGPERTLGVFVPLAEQAAGIADNLRHITPKVVAVSASPYQGAAGLERAAVKMAGLDPDLVVLHCMGYREEHRRIMSRTLSSPTMVANSMVARTIRELLTGMRAD